MTSRLSKISILIFIVLILTQLLSAGQIVIYGDTRTNDDMHRLIISKISMHNPQIAFHTGDLVSRGQQQAEYDKWLQISKPLSDLCRIYPAKGNHERDRDLFLKQFSYLNGSTYYTVDFDSLRFIILDSTLDMFPGSTQYNWLSSILSEQSGRNSIVLMHHPVFSSGMHGDELGLQLFLPQTLKDKGVIAVFSAHDHSYERCVFEDIQYIVTGGGGAPLRDPENPNPHQIKYAKEHHYIIANRNESQLIFTVYGTEDQILDHFVLPLFK